MAQPSSPNVDAPATAAAETVASPSRLLPRRKLRSRIVRLLALAALASLAIGLLLLVFSAPIRSRYIAARLRHDIKIAKAKGELPDRTWYRVLDNEQVFQTGMTMAEVLAVMGPPAEPPRIGPTGTTFTWGVNGMKNDFYIFVTFDITGHLVNVH